MSKEKPIVITVLVKDGGYETIGILPSMLGPLAEAIRSKGSETAHLASKSIEVEGILITGKGIGERVIMLGMGGVKQP
ncbi:hypothetical protein MHH28_07800 [Paenibacillus sp. FSL K6-1217]|uniref:hypothetical protein n=1 Tax=Paenibacillus sp. FSL K6-1217 TaxID=2921466 RepID=UPI003252212B